MDVLQEVEEGAVAPGLGVAGVAAVGTVLVGEFGKTGPRIVLDVLAGNEQSRMQVMECVLSRGISILTLCKCIAKTNLVLVEVKICAEEVTKRPSPFRTLHEAQRVNHAV